MLKLLLLLKSDSHQGWQIGNRCVELFECVIMCQNTISVWNYLETNVLYSLCTLVSISQVPKFDKHDFKTMQSPHWCLYLG